MINIKKVLILAPHIDDGEMGCGGTIAKFIEEGIDIYYVSFTTDETIEFVDVRKQEIKKAIKILDIPEDNLILYDYPIRNLNKYRQEILEDMIVLNKELKPDLVFLPSTQDTHQDHEVITKEAFRAFKKNCIMLGFESPWNNLVFTSQLIVSLDQRHIDKKIKASDCYKSQSDKFYMNKRSIESLAIAKGLQIGVPWAETFQVIRWIIK